MTLDFLYAPIWDSVDIYGIDQIRIIFDLMTKSPKVGDGVELFFDQSPLSRLIYGSEEVRLRALKVPSRVGLSMALEALDGAPDTDDSDDGASGDGDQSSKEDQTSDNDAPDPTPPVRDPAVDDGAADPGVPPPALPTGAPTLETDTIDLISFDKTGEGVNATLYRNAVVALNAKLRADASIPVTAEVRDALDFWVNGLLYRAAISSTIGQIGQLGLQKYLKAVSTEGRKE